jgi:Activator of Hsp90 ATPase homolog 1-like protein
VSASIRIATVRKSIRVRATPLAAFEFFTAGIDRWWPKSHNIGQAPIRRCVVEPRVGGRWYTELTDGSEVTIGHVRVWEPGRRFVFTWEISAQWRPEPRVALASEVEVQFTEEGATHTRVDLEHRDFERMGEGGEAMRAAVDGGWIGILELYRQALEGGTALP